MERFDSVRDAFADRNVPLHLLLGLISLARGLDGVVRVERRPPPDRLVAPAPEHEVTYLILGLISLQTTLLAAVEPILTAHRHRPRRAPRSASSPLPDLLR